MHHLSFFCRGRAIYTLFCRRKAVRAVFSRLFILAGFFLLTAVLFGRSLIAGGFSVLGLHESLLFFAWLIVAILLISEFKSGNSANGIIALPVVVALLGVARFIDSAIKPIPPALQSGWLGIHVTSCFLGYACFVLGFCFALLYLWQEAEIRSHKVDRNFFGCRHWKCWIQWNTGLWYLVLFFEHRYHKRFNVGPARLGCVLELGSKRNIFPGPLVCVSGISPRQDCKGVAGRRSAYCAIAGFILMIFTYIGASFMFSGLHSYL